MRAFRPEMDGRSFLFTDCQLLILGLYFEHIILGLLFFPLNQEPFLMQTHLRPLPRSNDSVNNLETF